MSSARVESAERFREIIAQDQYQNHLINDAQVNALEKESKNSIPALVWRVGKIKKNGQARMLGIRPGDYISEISGERPWIGNLLDFARPEPEMLTLHRGSQPVKTIKYQARKMDWSVNAQDRVEIAYLRNQIGNRSEDWDQHLLTACLNWRNKPSVAETAMHHALKAVGN